MSALVRLVLLAAIAGILLVAPPVQADRLESDSFVVTFGNFNITAGEKSSASYNLTDTVGQTGAGPFGEYGSSTYFVGSGFQYIYQIDTFGFSISDVDIDLGELTPGVHNTASHNLTISTKGAGGYTIYAYEETPLTHSNGTDTIADTTCDAATPCDEDDADVWSDQDLEGFGYNVSGTDAVNEFAGSTYFRPFADGSAAEAMRAIANSDDIVDSRQATVTYKAGVTGLTPAGDYQTSIVYVAVPGY